MEPTEPQIELEMHIKEPSELFAAFVKAQAELGHAKKDSVNPHFNRTYADLASALDAGRMPLAQAGLAIMQWPIDGRANGVTVVTMLVHPGGEWIRGKLTVPVAKGDAQGVGSAITYGRRYTLMAVAGIAAEDDDGNAATQAKPDQKQAAGKRTAPANKSAADSREPAPKTEEQDQSVRARIFRLWGAAQKEGMSADEWPKWISSTLGAGKDVNKLTAEEVTKLEEQLAKGKQLVGGEESAATPFMRMLQLGALHGMKEAQIVSRATGILNGKDRAKWTPADVETVAATLSSPLGAPK